MMFFHNFVCLNVSNSSEIVIILVYFCKKYTFT